MKKFFKVLSIAAGAVVLIIVAFLIYFNSTFPKTSPPSDVKVKITPERIARGKYLANHVTGCMDCHSTRDFTKYAGPVIFSTRGEGGEKFDKEMVDVPGTIYSLNITPAGIGNWTDGEIIRAVTTGVTKDGKALFPIMPYYNFNHLSKKDLFSLVAYIRTLKPIENKIPERHLDFPVSLLVKTMPLRSYKPAAAPDTSNSLAYGKYLVTIAGCSDCHTPSEKGKPIQKLSFAGGMEFHFPMGTVRSANITPDTETGIGKWTKDYFVSRFKYFDSDSTRNIKVSKDEFNTIMPWTFFGGMTKNDLGAIYTYLRTLKPVNHKIVKFTPKKINKLN